MLDERRVLLLTDGHLGVFSSKTATCILRYRPRDVVALLDRHHAGRERLTHHPEVAIPPVPELIELHERVMAPLFPSRVVGVALNTVGMDAAAARLAIEAAEGETGLPATDAVRFGPQRLVEVIGGLL